MNFKHGHARKGATSRTYYIWQAMLSRCQNEKHEAYEEYGGRGICVCDRWLDFTTFLEDMGECPPNHSIERANNDKGYEPTNCRWATAREQSRNRRHLRLYAYAGQQKLLVDWSQELGIPLTTLYMRLHQYGWSTDKAFTTPVRKRSAA